MGLIVDLKSTLDARRAAFERSIHGYGYHIQAAFYALGFEAITGEALRDFAFISVEKHPPYAVAVYRLDDAAIAHGAKLVRQALRTYAGCLERNYWPAYSESIETVSLPAWVRLDPETEETA
jgi:exodeoxyribonuclease VIII